MSVVKINALQIPPQAGDEIVKRFAARIDELSEVDGFEGFELLKPTGEAESRWFVYTRWADEDAYLAWRNSDTFARGHAASGPSSGGHPGGHPGGAEGRPDAASESGGHGAGGHPGQQGGPPPVSTGATLLEFEVALARDPQA
jgi:heme-degrading monooxygenase HmoA